MPWSFVRSMRRALSVVSMGALALASGSCESAPPDPISRWGLFADPATHTPVEGVEPYELNSPLFSDYSVKHRYIRLPEGTRITVRDDGTWQFPEGTVLVKTFGFLRDYRDPSLGERVIETRLLVLEEGEWEPYVYMWNETVTEAFAQPAGARVPVTFIDGAGETVSITYRVPNVVQCGNCHGGTGPTLPLGPRTQQLDRMHDYGSGPESQIDHLVSIGWLEGAPAAGERDTWTDYADETAPLDARARSYLHANCAHCHREGGAASQSGLWYDIGIDDEVRLGFCKIPAAAGRGTGGRPVDLWPGDSSRSIMTFRMASTEAGVKMPELPTVLAHTEGVALIEQWIDAMPDRECTSGGM